MSAFAEDFEDDVKPLIWGMDEGQEISRNMSIPQARTRATTLRNKLLEHSTATGLKAYWAAHEELIDAISYANCQAGEDLAEAYSEYLSELTAEEESESGGTGQPIERKYDGS